MQNSTTPGKINIQHAEELHQIPLIIRKNEMEIFW